MPDIQQKITIAIDGYSSCGKSTLAKDLASRLDYIHIDSGAMYRAVAFYILQHQIDIDDITAVNAALGQIDISFQYVSTEVHTFLNGADIENDIRSIAVSNLVSPVAAISTVRRALVTQQRMMGRNKGIVMDGRDIGTVVFTNAELKLFITASLEERIKRRTLDLKSKGLEATSEEIERSIVDRDRIDSTRSDSPLRKADDAVVIDNTQLSREQQLEVAYHLALIKIEQNIR
ncbi:MAG: (d)CMP kinase [Bacteroidetes bacterium]|nr:MAG: (d)CMP kinase [Bacteroidota bacterium]